MCNLKKAGMRSKKSCRFEEVTPGISVVCAHYGAIAIHRGAVEYCFIKCSLRDSD